jgi:hypothetical protein
MLNLAGEVGSKDDLSWLAERLGSAESELAWQAMLKIFKDASADVLELWVEQFSHGSGVRGLESGVKGRLSDEQMVSLLEMAERKASSEKRLQMLKDVRDRLAELYVKGGRFEQAAKCLGLLWEAAGGPGEKEAILGRLLDVYLRWPNLEAAKGLVANQLLEADLDPNGVIVRSIENYLTTHTGGAEPNAVMETLMQIETAVARPLWAEQMKRWSQQLSQSAEPNEPQ